MKSKIILIAFLVSMLTGAVISYRGCRSNQKKVQTTKAVSKVAQYDSVKYYRDLWNTEHAVCQQQRGDIASLKLFNGKYVDSLKKRLHLRDKQLQDAYRVLAEARGRIEMVPQYIHDTIPGTAVPFSGQYFAWADSSVSLTGYVDSIKATVFYSVDLSLGVTTYWKRKWFLGKKRYYVDAFSPNKNIHISGLKGLKVN